MVEQEDRVPELPSALLDKILERPALYLGTTSLVQLAAYLGGYAHGIGYEREDALYDGFQVWVQKKFKVQSMHHWSKIIAFYSGNDVTSFEATKELWSEYKSKPKQKKLIAAGKRK